MVIAHQAPSVPKAADDRGDSSRLGVRTDRRYVSPDEWLRENPGTFGRTAFYEMLQAGRLPHVRVRRKYLVPSDLLDLLLAKQIDSAIESSTSAA